MFALRSWWSQEQTGILKGVLEECHWWFSAHPGLLNCHSTLQDLERFTQHCWSFRVCLVPQHCTGFKLVREHGSHQNAQVLGGEVVQHANLPCITQTPREQIAIAQLIITDNLLGIFFKRQSFLHKTSTILPYLPEIIISHFLILTSLFDVIYFYYAHFPFLITWLISLSHFCKLNAPFADNY